MTKEGKERRKGRKKDLKRIRNHRFAVLLTYKVQYAYGNDLISRETDIGQTVLITDSVTSCSPRGVHYMLRLLPRIVTQRDGGSHQLHHI